VGEQELVIFSEKIFPALECAIVFVVSCLAFVSFHPPFNRIAAVEVNKHLSFPNFMLEWYVGCSVPTCLVCLFLAEDSTGYVSQSTLLRVLAWTMSGEVRTGLT